MDMNTPPLGVDIGDLKKQCLMESEATRVHCGEISFILDGTSRIDNGPDLVHAQNSGECLIPFGMDEFQGVPVPFEHVDEEEFNAAVAYPHSRGGPFIVVFSVEEIVLKLLLSDFVRSLLIKIDQLPDRARIAFLCTLAHTGKLQSPHGFLVIVLHHKSPFLF
jgi:hypothetical protein